VDFRGKGPLAHGIGQGIVLFQDFKVLGAAFQNMFGQRAAARPDLKDKIVRPYVQGGNYLTGDVLIAQKILAKAALGRAV
jgi:hypothetical protein